MGNAKGLKKGLDHICLHRNYAIDPLISQSIKVYCYVSKYSACDLIWDTTKRYGKSKPKYNSSSAAYHKSGVSSTFEVITKSLYRIFVAASTISTFSVHWKVPWLTDRNDGRRKSKIVPLRLQCLKSKLEITFSFTSFI